MPDGVAFYPVLSGLAAGDQIVTSGSFLVDAETRLNPAAGSIYFGGSSGAQGRDGRARPSARRRRKTRTRRSWRHSPSCRRPTASWPRSSGFCPILPRQPAGLDGVPVKLTLAGETVFLCCAGCKGQATAEPREDGRRRVEANSREPAANAGGRAMIERIIEWSIRNRFLVLILAAALTRGRRLCRVSTRRWMRSPT